MNNAARPLRSQRQKSKPDKGYFSASTLSAGSRRAPAAVSPKPARSDWPSGPITGLSCFVSNQHHEFHKNSIGPVWLGTIEFDNDVRTAIVLLIERCRFYCVLHLLFPKTRRIVF
jgi:hypothetical protein